MSCTKKQTAVLYFTRSAHEEARAKVFCTSGNFAQNRAVAKKLIGHTYKQIKRSKLPLKVFNSKAQEGHTFGEKLGNAFQSLFDEGYENVIAVGNDCVQLSSETIDYTADLLLENPLVAGPASDGGAYLLGINRKAFHKKNFSRLAWQTHALLDDFILYADSLGFKLLQLVSSSDIDDAGALQRFLRDAESLDLYRRLITLLLSIINSLSNWNTKPETFFRSPFLRCCLSYRGPPFSRAC